jgi:hypothetical protein
MSVKTLKRVPKPNMRFPLTSDLRSLLSVSLLLSPDCGWLVDLRRPFGTADS